MQDALNQLIWDGMTLRPEVGAHLLAVATKFVTSLEIGQQATDIIFTGSLACYSWTEKSDIDLHVVLDFKQIDGGGKLVKDFMMAKKGLWNDKHHVVIKGFPVELYAQDVLETHYAQGIYSVLDNKWVKEPSKNAPMTVDEKEVEKKAEYIMYEIEVAIGAKDLEKLSAISIKLRDMRGAGLAAGGEYSVENQTFKKLRRNGYLDKLAKAKLEISDQLMSLNNKESKMEKQAEVGKSLTKEEKKGQFGSLVVAPGRFVTTEDGKIVVSVPSSAQRENALFTPVQADAFTHFLATLLSNQEYDLGTEAPYISDEAMKSFGAKSSKKTTANEEENGTYSLTMYIGDVSAKSEEAAYKKVKRMISEYSNSNTYKLTCSDTTATTTGTLYYFKLTDSFEGDSLSYANDILTGNYPPISEPVIMSFTVKTPSGAEYDENTWEEVWPTGSRSFNAAKKTTADYQGYKNYETWTVALLLDNDQGSQEMVKEWAQEAVAEAAGASQVKDGIWNVSEAAKFNLADRIKGHIKDNNPLSGKGDVYEQLLGAAISEVDWVEVAELFLEEVEPESVKEGSLMAEIENMGKTATAKEQGEFHRTDVSVSSTTLLPAKDIIKKFTDRAKKDGYEKVYNVHDNDLLPSEPDHYAVIVEKQGNNLAAHEVGYSLQYYDFKSYSDEIKEGSLMAAIDNMGKTTAPEVPVSQADDVEQKIADIINSGVSLMSLRTHLEGIFPKKDIDFAMSPIAHFRIKTKKGTLIIVNKKYADDIDIEAGELSIGYEKKASVSQTAGADSEPMAKKFKDRFDALAYMVDMFGAESVLDQLVRALGDDVAMDNFGYIARMNDLNPEIEKLPDRGTAPVEGMETEGSLMAEIDKMGKTK